MSFIEDVMSEHVEVPDVAVFYLDKTSLVRYLPAHVAEQVERSETRDLTVE